MATKSIPYSASIRAALIAAFGQHDGLTSPIVARKGKKPQAAQVSNAAPRAPVRPKA